MLDGELAHHEDRKPDDSDDEAGDNEVRTEPILFLSLVEHDLERPNGDDEQAEAPVVNANAALANRGEIRRVFDHAVGEVERQDAHRNVEEEDPTPTVVVHDPATHGGAEHWRHDHCHAINSKSHAAFFRRKGVRENGLLAWLQPAASRALNNAKENQHP